VVDLPRCRLSSWASGSGGSRSRATGSKCRLIIDLDLDLSRSVGAKIERAIWHVGSQLRG
jgi:hypothetical protein